MAYLRLGCIKQASGHSMSIGLKRAIEYIYNPEKTKMILEAEEAGCQAIGGKGMLLYQGVVNYSLFTGKDFPIEEYQKFQAEQAK